MEFKKLSLYKKKLKSVFFIAMLHPVVSNTITQTRLNCKIKLETLAQHFGVALKLEKWDGLFVLERHHAQAIVCRAGYFLTIGGTTEAESRDLAMRFFRDIETVTPGAVVAYTEVMNVLAEANLGRHIDLGRLSDVVLPCIFTAPCLTGVRLSLDKPRVDALVFADGLVLLSRMKGFEFVNIAWDTVSEVLKPFIKLKLETFVVHEKTHNTYGNECLVCMSDLKVNDIANLLGCGHTFHATCIGAWLKKRTTCPTCRRDVEDYAALHAESSNSAARLIVVGASPGIAA